MQETVNTVLSVSELNHTVCHLLEYSCGVVEVGGEVSNLARPSSGHIYFTLKDDKAQIRCAFFKGRQTSKNYQLENGNKVVLTGKVTLFEPRGDYQLVVSNMLAEGLGDLHLQFEALKKKLALEGLFDQGLKKTLPKYPSKIGIITSNTGAAIQDILTTLKNRYPIATISLYACEVQGKNAATSIAKMINQANSDGLCDVLIIARGGGSIEDLWAFNDEKLARTIVNSVTPIISGVGHETDFTIADFVADARAATPTAAAQLATPDKMELISQFEQYIDYLKKKCIQYILFKLTHCEHLQKRLISPRQIIHTRMQQLDFLTAKLNQKIKTILDTKRHHNFNGLLMQLESVSPLATLKRGYAIASHNDKIIRNADEVQVNDALQLQLFKGTITCSVITKKS